MPLSSLMKMASLDAEDLAVIEAKEVRVRLSLTEPAELQTRDVTLALDFINADDSSSSYKFQLSMISSDREIGLSNWFGNTPSKSVYEFELTPLSQLEFGNFQKEFLKLGKPKKYHWTVYYHLVKREQVTKELTIDMELKLDRGEGYFYQLKSAPISVNSQRTQDD